jgi:hypothetical protein
MPDETPGRRTKSRLALAFIEGHHFLARSRFYWGFGNRLWRRVRRRQSEAPASRQLPYRPAHSLNCSFATSRVGRWLYRESHISETRKRAIRDIAMSAFRRITDNISSFHRCVTQVTALIRDNARLWVRWRPLHPCEDPLDFWLRRCRSEARDAISLCRLHA